MVLWSDETNNSGAMCGVILTVPTHLNNTLPVWWRVVVAASCCGDYLPSAGMGIWSEWMHLYTQDLACFCPQKEIGLARNLNIQLFLSDVLYLVRNIINYQ